MNGNSISKILGASWECPNHGFANCTLRSCPIKKREWRRLQHLARKDRENKENRERYNRKYKNDSKWMKKRSESWKEFAKKKGSQWSRERSKKYRKKYSELSPAQRSKARKSYDRWAKHNWNRRVEYARHYRRKKDPNIGLKQAIREAGKRGDFSELIKRLGDAIARLDEESNCNGSDAIDSERRL